MPISRAGGRGGSSTSELRQVEQRLENRILNVENVCVELRRGQVQILDRLDKVDSRLDNLESMVQEILTLLSVEKVK